MQTWLRRKVYGWAVALSKNFTLYKGSTKFSVFCRKILPTLILFRGILKAIISATCLGIIYFLKTCDTLKKYLKNKLCVCTHTYTHIHIDNAYTEPLNLFLLG